MLNEKTYFFLIRTLLIILTVHLRRNQVLTLKSLTHSIVRATKRNVPPELLHYISEKYPSHFTIRPHLTKTELVFDPK